MSLEREKGADVANMNSNNPSSISTESAAPPKQRPRLESSNGTKQANPFIDEKQTSNIDIVLKVEKKESRIFPDEELTNIELEAIFYPKFENEASDQKQIRESMLETIFDSSGYLEVSLKHSGSLILWSGYDRVYAKNSMDNKFCLVGEILLREHFIRSWSIDTASNNDKNLAGTIRQTGHKQEESDQYASLKFLECSREMEKLNLTCSFECVTSVLGDHGDIPNKDFIILTAIADRDNETFYSTSEIVDFAQKWRLPHNDVWIFRTPTSANALFYLYDTSREEGLADTTISELNQSADYHIVSMYPHVIFQGNILEGIVIRLIESNGSNSEMVSKWERLSHESKEILMLIPPEKKTFSERSNGFTFSSITKFDQNDNVIEKELFMFMKRKYGENRRIIQRGETNGKNRQDQQLLAMINRLNEKCMLHKEGSSSLTNQTKRIIALIRKLENLDIKLHYKLYRETRQYKDPNKSKSISWVCALHILRDSAFLKYKKNMKKDDMMLFRGFLFDFYSMLYQNKKLILYQKRQILTLITKLGQCLK